MPKQNNLCRQTPARVVGAAILLLIGGMAAAAAAPLRIVTTTTDLACIAQSIAGDCASVSSISSGRQDPHFLEAKPSYIMQARDADLWIRIGMELEVGWEPLLIRSSRNTRIREGTAGHLDASENVIRRDVPTERVTRAMGDIHACGNPHYWLDPLNGRIIAEAITARLSQLAPEQAAVFAANLQQFKRDLDMRMFGAALVNKFGGDMLWTMLLLDRLEATLEAQELMPLLGGWYGRLRPHRNKVVLSYHRSWNYFTERFGLVNIGELEPKPGVPPSAAHLGIIIDRVKTADVKAIIIEPFYPTRAANLVAARTPAEVVVIANSVGGSVEATDYLSMLDNVVNQLCQRL